MIKSRDAKQEWEQQSAFEEAERQRADRRAGAVFDSFVDSCPVPIEVYDAAGRFLKSNKAAERLLGKLDPSGVSLSDERGLKRTGLLEPQLKRVMAGTRVETPPTWYDPTEIGLAGVPGRKVCFQATVFPLFDAESRIVKVAVSYADLTGAMSERESAKPTRPVEAEEAPSDDVREVEFRRRKAEQALREAEEKYRALVASAPGVLLFEQSEDGKFVAVSAGVESVWGVSAATVQTDQSAFLAQVHQEDREAVQRVEAEARAGGSYPDQFRFRVVNRRSGATHWVEASGRVLRVAGRRSYHLVARDVSAAVEAEQALGASTAALEALYGAEHVGVCRLDRSLKVVSWSPGAERETGRPAGEVVGSLITEAYPEFGPAGFLKAVADSLSGRVSRRHEAFYQDGREEYAGWFSISTLPADSGLLLFIRNTGREHELERTLAARQADVDAILSSKAVGVVVVDRKLVVTGWSETAERETRVSAKEATGRELTEIYPELERVGLPALVREVIATGTSARLEAHYDDGREKYAGWFDFAAYRFGPGALLAVRNITRLKRAEQAWVEADTRLRALLESPGLAVTTKDAQLRYTSTNAAGLKMLGLGAGRGAVGRTDEELLKPNVAELLASCDRKALSGTEPEVVELVLPDGMTKGAAWYRVAKSALKSASGGTVGVLTVGVDITKRVAALQELSRRREFLEATVREQTRTLDKVRKELEGWQRVPEAGRGPDDTR